MEEYRQIGKDKLRMGYTTGSCAAAAAKAATQMLLSGRSVRRVRLMTPKGISLDLPVEDPSIDGQPVPASGKDGEKGPSFSGQPGEAGKGPRRAACAIRKDSGDDPDVTHGVLVYAEVSFPEEDGDGDSCQNGARPGREALGQAERIQIDGGVGVGRVTRPGLEQPVGSAAINRVPRQMIREAVEEICEEAEYTGSLQVLISIPAGVDLAKKTFNPNLGIVGGISVLGTSGIVEPMSEAALIRSIRVELGMLSEYYGKDLIFSPGNYGNHYVQDRWPSLIRSDAPKQIDGLPMMPCLKFSNYVGEALRFAVELELKHVLFVAHIGKFVKVAGGIMNTHSKEADARLEILAAAAIRAGASAGIAGQLLDCTTTDAGIDVLAKEDDLLQKTMQIILEKALYHLRRKVGEDMEIGLVIFSNAHGTLAESDNVEKLIGLVAKEMEAEAAYED